MKENGHNFLKFRFLNPMREFLHDSRAMGIILLSCTVFSLLIANVPGGEQYVNFWHLSLPGANELLLPGSLLHLINDGLMAVFFFLVGMEIRKELIDGELSSLKKSVLPVAAAIGGILLPAGIYLFFNAGTAYTHGWAVPTATDIAFSLGVASLLGKKFPLTLKIFLTALAIIDDLGAILIIALFYGENLHLMFLAGSAALLLTAGIIAKTSLPKWMLIVLGVALWFCMFNSGIHATIAGVAFAFIIPVKDLDRLQLKLHNWVYFLIMPVFALANTAILLPENAMGELGSSASVGIILGLFIGKPVGIVLTCLLLVSLKISPLPRHCGWHQMIGAGLLAGIGFTMSIFIATLAFKSEIADIAKVAVLIASVASSIGGILWIRAFAKRGANAEV